MILQTENGNRLKSELCSMASKLTKEEKDLVNENVFFHTLETEADSFLSLALAKNKAEISRLIQDIKPTGVVYDVLRNCGIGNLIGDEDMTTTLSEIGQLTRRNDPQRISVII